MEIGSRIKQLRSEKGISQEQLAEKVYVTRQTISSWENGKSYPDIHSLLLLGNVFEISLDNLIKGDIDTMRNEIRAEDIREFNKMSKVYSALIAVTLLAVIPLVRFLGIIGIIIEVCLAIGCIAYAFKLEGFKKQHDIRTYREIVAFSEGKTLDEIEKAREDGKAPYQNVLKFFCGMIVGIIVYIICSIFLK